MAARLLFKQGLTGWHVLVIFCTFFGAVFAVTGAFFWIAQKTFPGSDPAAYRRGLYYNRILAEAARQDELGWRVSAAYEGGRLVVTLADRQGQPLVRERVDAHVGRPTTNRFDQTLSLDEQGSGTYAAALPLESGYWDVSVRVNAAEGGTQFRERFRLWVGQRP